MMGFLARWARRLSWRETAQVFQVSWEAVYRSVEWFVQWGLAHRALHGVEAIGVDEIHWGRGLRAENFLTVIYQIDAHCRRLLWVGKGRSKATLRRGLKALGPEVVQGLRFVCSDMWKPYLQVMAAQAGHALHVLDRFHITMHLNQAVDQVRRVESSHLRATGLARQKLLVVQGFHPFPRSFIFDRPQARDYRLRSGDFKRSPQSENALSNLDLSHSRVASGQNCPIHTLEVDPNNFFCGKDSVASTRRCRTAAIGSGECQSRQQEWVFRSER
jgi:hypothetical protein